MRGSVEPSYDRLAEAAVLGSSKVRIARCAQRQVAAEC